MYESMQDFANRTGMSYSGVRLLCLSGKLPFVSIGRKRMIYIAGALEALQKMSEQALEGKTP